MKIKNLPPKRDPATGGKNSKFKNFIFICGLWSVVCGLIGCDAFVRKFTRKPKKDKLPTEAVLITPEEYRAPPKEELYRKYFLFWKSWQDELITALAPYGANQKKQIDCAKEAIKNLDMLRELLTGEKQKKLGIYIQQLQDLKDSITRDIAGSNTSRNHFTAEQIKRNILRHF